MQIFVGTGAVAIKREQGEPRIKNESHLLHKLKVELNKRGLRLIKKRMWKDGHLVSDEQQYLRSERSVKMKEAIAIYDMSYAVRSSAEDFNKGDEVVFRLTHIGLN